MSALQKLAYRLLAAHPNGLCTGDICAALNVSKSAVKRLPQSADFVRIGTGMYTRLCLPEHKAAAEAHIAVLRADAKARRREWDMLRNERPRRAKLVDQPAPQKPLTRHWPAPAWTPPSPPVPSIWALAALAEAA